MEVDDFIVEKLLGGRERDYQNALKIARQYFTGLEGFIDSAEGSKAVTDDIMKRISEERSTARRGRRAVTSEPTYIFEDDVLNYAWGHGDGTLSSDIQKTETAQRRQSQPIPGTQAHHQASVSSTESLVQNMDEFEVRRLWDMAEENGFNIGSRSKGFMALSGPAHLGGGKKWGTDFAHVGADGVTTDPGRFKMEPLPKGTTAKQAWPILKENLLQQRAVNAKAYNHPLEQKMRSEAEARLGKPIVWNGGNKDELKVQNKAAYDLGINATALTEGYMGKSQPTKPVVQVAPKVAPKPTPKSVAPTTDIKALPPTAQRKPGHVSLKDQLKTKPPTKPVAAAGTVTKLPPKPTKTKPKPAVSKPDKPNRKQLSPSEQIRLLQNAVQDAIPIHPGMSLPSYSLIQGI